MSVWPLLLAFWCGGALVASTPTAAAACFGCGWDWGRFLRAVFAWPWLSLRSCLAARDRKRRYLRALACGLARARRRLH